MTRKGKIPAAGVERKKVKYERKDKNDDCPDESIPASGYEQVVQNSIHLCLKKLFKYLT